MSDLISRQAAIRWVKTEWNPFGKPTLEFESGKKVIEHLEQMPSAQPERIRGRWVERWHENKHVIGDMACSVCGAQMLLTFPRFCPNCGADMREDQ